MQHNYIIPADTPAGQSTHTNARNNKIHLLLFLTMSRPQVVPSAAGMNLVSHRCPARWHQSDLQMSCQTNQTQMKGWFTTDPPLMLPLDQSWYGWSAPDTQALGFSSKPWCQVVVSRTTQSIRQNRSNGVKGSPNPPFPVCAHSFTTHQLGLADKRNADVVFDLVLGKHGRELEKL